MSSERSAYHLNKCADTLETHRLYWTDIVVTPSYRFSSPSTINALGPSEPARHHDLTDVISFLRYSPIANDNALPNHRCTDIPDESDCSHPGFPDSQPLWPLEPAAGDFTALPGISSAHEF